MESPTRPDFRRLAGALFFGVFAGYRITQYQAYRSHTLWTVEVLLGLCLTGVYFVRLPARQSAGGLLEKTLPYLGLVLPLSLMAMPAEHPWPIPAWVWGLIGSGLAVEGLGLASLGRSFSIGIEYRALVTGGIYRFIRHPMYLGQCLYTAGAAWLHHGVASAAMLVGFIAIQGTRAVLEERHLAEWDAEYRAYRERTLPRRRRSS